MRKVFSSSFLVLFLLIVIFAIILSTKGVETNRFNKVITNKVAKIDDNLKLEISTIKFKFDIKEISLFLETSNPQIEYKDSFIPTKNIKVYIDFVSLIKSDAKIQKIILDLDQLDIDQLKNISINFKPSNFVQFLNNKIQKGNLSSTIELYFDKINALDNFIARGNVSEFETEILNGFNITKTNFDFFADKTDVLIKNISGNLEFIKINDGDIKVNLSPEISLVSNFNSIIKYQNKLKDNSNPFKKFKHLKNLVKFDGTLNNNFSISFDKTYKIKKYEFKSNGKLLRADLTFKKPLSNIFLSEKINELALNGTKVVSIFSPKKRTINLSGNYSLNNGDKLPFEFKNNVNKGLSNYLLNIDYDKPLDLKVINYKKTNKKVAKILLNFEKKEQNVEIKNLNFTEGENIIKAKKIRLNKNKFISSQNISVKTSKDGKINNDFNISFEKKILVKGKRFDATNLPKIFNQKSENNLFINVTKDIEIDFKNIAVPLSEELQNFKLIGKIEEGKFTKISSKGNFDKNNFLDITLKQDKKNKKKKYLEIYSDLSKPLLTEYNFFKGLTGGNLLYSSIIEEGEINSKLKIEDFKVVNAPGLVKLLSLADLGGLADLAAGEGLSFDILEIGMVKKNNTIRFNEILALGPSISVLMEGYQDTNITSIRGTLVPAKTINKMISKIPVIGDIVIPKEVGEGLFGISFKMKGPPGKIKTSINPIRTITPRFIQKIIDKNKKAK